MIVVLTLVLGVMWCSAELDKWEAERFDEDARDARKRAVQSDTLATRYANRCSDSWVKLEKILGSWYVTAGPGSAAAHASMLLCEPCAEKRRGEEHG